MWVARLETAEWTSVTTTWKCTNAKVWALKETHIKRNKDEILEQWSEEVTALDQSMTVGKKQLRCTVLKLNNGMNVWRSPEVPGGVARIESSRLFQDLVDFKFGM